MLYYLQGLWALGIIFGIKVFVTIILQYKSSTREKNQIGSGVLRSNNLAHVWSEATTATDRSELMAQWTPLLTEPIKEPEKSNNKGLTRSRAQGTSGNPGQMQGTSATGTPRTSPAELHHPICLPPAAELVSQRTRGSWVGLCSRWSQCGGTAAGNTGRNGGCTPAARGAVRRAGAPGTGGTLEGWTPQMRGSQLGTAGSKKVVWSKRWGDGLEESQQLWVRSRSQQRQTQVLSSRQQGGAVVACGDGGIGEGALQLWGPYESPVYCGTGWRKRCAPDVCPQHDS